MSVMVDWEIRGSLSWKYTGEFSEGAVGSQIFKDEVQ